MKANEAPEKIYIFENPVLDFTKLSVKQSDEDIEYTRTDAFIEKAAEFMCNNIDKQLTIYHNNTWRTRDEFIEDFKKYMKGE